MANEEHLNDQMVVRREKMQALRDQGVAPFGHRFDPDHDLSTDIRKKYENEFRFAWKDITKTGMGTKDYIAPDSFDFRQSRTFRVGQMWGAASYLQIMASELSDKLLLEILELDAELTVTMHIQAVDQVKAIKTVKGKISDIDKMKVEEQRKATRAG